ncbi:MAG: hypothetical protein IIZ78_12655 [Clostridiales bacterium]|nr:hypothetical protein [Clostridiales bacterium]
MGEEFSFFQRIEDNYSVADILDILGITVEQLLKDYLRDEVMAHRNDFDIYAPDDYEEDFECII